VKSVIYEADMVVNTDRRIGSALEYCPARFVRRDGTETALMFTVADFDTPALRAGANPEDMPAPTPAPAPTDALAWVPWAISVIAIVIAILIVTL
jgi:hypothetical protein